MSPAKCLDKAQRAVESAQILLHAADPVGACNRAYYAMFDAARAALMTVQPPPASEAIKTHNGLFCAFSLQLVKSGHVPVEFGKSFSKVYEIRRAADYLVAEVGADRAAWAIERAKEFVAAMRTRCASAT